MSEWKGGEITKMDIAYAMGSQGAGGTGGGMGNLTIIFPILIVAIFYFLIIRPQQIEGETAQSLYDEPQKGRYSCDFGRFVW